MSNRLGYPIYAPDSVSFAVTDKCNLKCRMCGYWKKVEGSRRALDIRECRDFFSDLAKNGIKRIQFTGGEPLMRPDIFDILKMAKCYGLETTLVTNGTMIDRDNSDLIVDLTDYIYISLDAPNAEIHDSVRGVPRTFEKTKDALSFLLKSRNKTKRKTRLTVCSTITMASLHDPKEMLALIRHLGADRLIYNPASATSYGYSSLTNDFMMNDAEISKYNKMIDDILELMNKGETMIRSNPFYLESSKKFLQGDKRYFNFQCYSGGYNGPLVSFDGEVFPCCAWNFSLGNIRTKTFSQIWKSNEAQAARKRIKNKSCPMCYHHTRIFDYITHAPFLIKNPLKLWNGYLGLLKS